jgi:hypothetical protein
MRVDSLANRVEFDERRARALEGAVVYRARANDVAEETPGEGPGQRSRRLTARRWRRGRPPAASLMGSPGAPPPASGVSDSQARDTPSTPARDDPRAHDRTLSPPERKL